MIFLWLGILIVAIWLLIRSGVFVVRSIAKVSSLLGVSEFVVSFVLMAFATTLPEFSVGVSAAISKEPMLSLGNVIGSNIIHITFVLGLVAILGKGIVLDKRGNAFLSQSKWLDGLLIILPIILLLDGTLSRFDGGILLAAFLFHFTYLFWMRSSYKHTPHAYLGKEGERDKMFQVREGKRKKKETLFVLLKALGIFIASVGILILSSLVIVKSSVVIALELHIPELLIGIFIIGLGTTLPELTFGIRSVKEGIGQSSLGNLLGATLLNSTWVLGVVALIHPIHVVDYDIFLLGAIFMAAYVFLAIFFLKTRNQIDVIEGFFLVFLYIIFLVVQIVASQLRG